MQDPDFHSPRGGDGAGGRRGGGRIFGHGGLRLVLLRLIADRPRHGYELIKAIEERVQGRYSPSPGVVYPTLTLLEDTGLVAVDATGGAAGGAGSRKRYAATDAGLRHLAEQREAVEALLARMDAAPAAPHGEQPPPVERALHNLKFAIHSRLARGPLTDEQAHAFAAILDGATQQLDRI
ncbi:MAG: PadR family transcriptional regulator [Xylophilus ampelinus]